MLLAQTSFFGYYGGYYGITGVIPCPGRQLIVGKFGQSKCVARPVAKEIDKMKCEEEPHLLLGVALFIVKYMPANTKTVGRSTWRRLDK